MPEKSHTEPLNIAAELTAASKVLAPAVKRLKKEIAKFSADPKKQPTGALADTYYALTQLEKSLKLLRAPFDDCLEPAFKQLEEHFIQTLKVGESSGVQGKMSRLQITDSVIPTVVDWDKFYEHVRKTKSFELLNRAVNRTAIKERWDAKRDIPGVGKFHAKKISSTKLGGKH